MAKRLQSKEKQRLLWIKGRKQVKGHYRIVETRNGCKLYVRHEDIDEDHWRKMERDEKKQVK